ncbi:MAG: domain S-box protein [Chitinophagaceae bacterium]|nr:domain S-box protein [Chitinophagaceae bacterium]
MMRPTNPNEIIRSTNAFWVVGIGASAGGLDAFKSLIKTIPIDSGMAFIIVQHLDPNHESILVGLLQNMTALPVLEITDKVEVKPDHIYVIPSNKLLTANDGILNLTARPVKTQKSIDLFFTSLAEVHHNQAIGVVLSGTGKDGTLGLQAIKQYGGITFAQEQQTAAYDEMPQSAINQGVVDYVLSPEGIIRQLLELNAIYRKKLHSKEDIAEQGTEDIFYKQILNLLEAQKGVDFAYYKQTTVGRRIARRMDMLHLEKMEDYLHYIKEHSTELDQLYQDMLIPVTDFFRDPQMFDSLCKTVLPVITKNKTSDETFRVWVVGCSTGQEAYTIAICLHEFISQHSIRIKIQVFATDLSEIAIAKARTGIYSKSEVENISEERLNRFFTKTDNSYQANKIIRDICIFAMHNILSDPPFANMDLVSCRNVLIYMDAFLQRKAMTTFHYALNEKGILLLGKSESLSKSADLFNVFNEQEKMYTKKMTSGRFIHVAAKPKDSSFNNSVKSMKDLRLNDDFQKNAEQIILSKSPAGVIVNEQMEIVQFRGATGDWLESPSGKPSLNVLKMAKTGLAIDLRSALLKVKTSLQPFVKEGISVKVQKHTTLVTIEVIPLLHTINPYFLILFTNTELITPLSSGKQTIDGQIEINPHEIRAMQLEKELSQTRDDMRSITEDQEAGNEELLSANEELVSGSEELRSLNEELEISKEELQSTVEELSAANQELAVRNEQLNHYRKYAEAIVSTIREPLIVLDKDLRVKSTNSAFNKTFQETEHSTEGKLFYELKDNQWDIPELRILLERTLQEKDFYESYEVKRTFSVIGERIMLLNARKFFSEGNNEYLILLAIEDITERRTLEAKLKANADYLKAVFESSPQIATMASADGSVNYFNQFFLDYSGLNITEAIERGWQSVMRPEIYPKFLELWDHAINSGNDFYMRLMLKRSDGEYRWHIARALAIKNDMGVITSWVGTATDINDQKIFSDELERKVSERTQSLKESNADLAHSNKNLEQFAFIASHDLQEPLRKIRIFSNMISTSFGKHLPNEAVKLIDKINTSSERMSGLIKAVLNFSRIDSAKNQFTEVNLDEILTQVLEDFEVLITEKNAVVTKETLSIIQAVPLQMTQIFYNLISNSLKFTHPHLSPVITITSKIMTQEEVLSYPELNKKRTYSEIIFKDNGIGFEKKYEHQIFQIFQRLHSHEQFPGTGIGLALCKKIAINHHGEIFAKSNGSSGAVFHIILPQVQPTTYNPDAEPLVIASVPEVLFKQAPII